LFLSAEIVQLYNEYINKLAKKVEKNGVFFSKEDKIDNGLFVPESRSPGKSEIGV